MALNRKRDGVGREEGGGYRMGSTCISVADSFWCLAKLIQCLRFKNKIKLKKNKQKCIFSYFQRLEVWKQDVGPCSFCNLKRILLLCLTASSSAMCFLAYGSITPISDCLHMTILFMCVSTSSSFCVRQSLCPNSPFLMRMSVILN